MTDEELCNALDALCAFDLGNTCSRIGDPALKHAVRKELAKKTKNQRSVLLSRMVVTQYLCDDALNLGYGVEDAREFLVWLESEGL